MSEPHRERRTTPPLRITVALALALGSGLACNKADAPPPLPLTQAFNRMVPRTELVPLIVKDPERAAKVRQLHIELEALLLDAARTQVKRLSKVLVQDAPDPSEEEVREIFALHRAAGRETLDEYIALQLKLRELTTPEEFARLSRLR